MVKVKRATPLSNYFLKIYKCQSVCTLCCVWICQLSKSNDFMFSLISRRPHPPSVEPWPVVCWVLCLSATQNPAGTEEEQGKRRAGSWWALRCTHSPHTTPHIICACWRAHPGSDCLLGLSALEFCLSGVLFIWQVHTAHAPRNQPYMSGVKRIKNG